MKHIQEIYMEYIYIYIHMWNLQGKSLNIYDKNNQEQKHRPNGAAAEGGRPIGAPPKAAPVFLMIFSHRYLWILLIQS